MRCANTEALNRYLSEEEKFEKIVDNFTCEVLVVLKGLKYQAKSYDYYDLTDVLKDIIKEEFDL